MILFHLVHSYLEFYFPSLSPLLLVPDGCWCLQICCCPIAASADTILCLPLRFLLCWLQWLIFATVWFFVSKSNFFWLDKANVGINRWLLFRMFLSTYYLFMFFIIIIWILLCFDFPHPYLMFTLFLLPIFLFYFPLALSNIHGAN